MKYTININQKAIVDLGLQDKVDFIDLAIFDCISAFVQTNICNRIVIGEETYYMVKASLIIEQLPLLGISTDRGVSKRIDKLVESGLVERCPQNQALKSPYYKLGSIAKDVLFGTWNKCSKSTTNDCSKSNNNYYNNTDNNINKDNISSVSSGETDEEFAERIYALYPTECPMRKTRLGKSRKDKGRIISLLKTYSRADIEKVVKREIEEKYGKHYMQNFSTFLNNFPDPQTLFSQEQTDGMPTQPKVLVINGQIYR